MLAGWLSQRWCTAGLPLIRWDKNVDQDSTVFVAESHATFGVCNLIDRAGVIDVHADNTSEHVQNYKTDEGLIGCPDSSAQGLKSKT